MKELRADRGDYMFHIGSPPMCVFGAFAGRFGPLVSQKPTISSVSLWFLTTTYSRFLTVLGPIAQRIALNGPWQAPALWR